MSRGRETARGRAARALIAMGFVAAAGGGPVRAADVRERWSTPYGVEADRPDPGIEPPPRYFPRAEEDSAPRRERARPRRVACIPRRVPIPTDAPDDPSYVGSAYGLGKPSYYGFKPALGVDDPFGRSLLPYCN
ncbi:hypothetical protein [Methylobacterium sp. E-045]|uniref:hypothetical protein n=1 Tax=Methylobacterium sp. E-045 TaxID=2836575 RepID=UPI001FBA424F|nr:hypothetical protein [Methylobacterium sp. E-045]MCJ2129458.1 hypothetical protein [Methylobacterium sp. E-045]